MICKARSGARSRAWAKAARMVPQHAQTMSRPAWRGPFGQRGAHPRDDLHKAFPTGRAVSRRRAPKAMIGVALRGGQSVAGQAMPLTEILFAETGIGGQFRQGVATGANRPRGVDGATKLAGQPHRPRRQGGRQAAKGRASEQSADTSVLP